MSTLFGWFTWTWKLLLAIAAVSWIVKTFAFVANVITVCSVFFKTATSQGASFLLQATYVVCFIGTALIGISVSIVLALSGYLLPAGFVVGIALLVLALLHSFEPGS